MAECISDNSFVLMAVLVYVGGLFTGIILNITAFRWLESK